MEAKNFLVKAENLKTRKENFEKKYIKDTETLLKQYNEDKFFDFLRTLKYEEAKKIIEELNIFNYITKNGFKKTILEEIKLRDYPLLDGAYHFPVLNKIHFLQKGDIKALDKYLSGSRIQSISKVSLLNECCDKGKEADEVIKFLLDNYIIEETYNIHCNECFNSPTMKSLTKKDYEGYKKIFSLTEEEIDKMSEREYDEYTDVNYLTAFCDYCDHEVYIDSVEDLEKYTNISKFYRIIKEPINTEYDKI